MSDHEQEDACSEDQVETCSSGDAYEAVLESLEALDLGDENADSEKLGMLIQLADIAYDYSNNTETIEERLEWLKKAQAHALKAYELNSDTMDVLRVLCAVTGRLAEDSSMTEQITYGRQFKEYLDIAIGKDDESQPDVTFELRHMRGRFMYTVLNAGFIQRTVVRTFGWDLSFGYEEAIADLLKAEENIKGMPENHLFLGKCYLEKGDKEPAKEWLTKAAEAEQSSIKEMEMIQEAQKLLRENF